MLWEYEFFGTDIYHIIASFLIYSFLGWLVESIYMSICNRKLTNRGFAKGPFCPIYGVGAVVGYMILHPLEEHYILLYIAGAVIATVFEYLVGKLMLRLFGEVWWDYTEKPLNYKGLVCLESTIAWGFYAIIIIMFLNAKIMEWIDRYSGEWGRWLVAIFMMIAFCDFSVQLYHVLNLNFKKSCDIVRKYYHFLRDRRL